MSLDWKNSSGFLEFQAACSCDDHLQCARIIDEGVKSIDPVERAYWLALKALQFAEEPKISGHLDRAWDTLEEALSVAPDPGLYDLRVWLLQFATAVLTYEGPVHRGQALFRKMLPGLWQLVREPVISYNIAALNLMVGRFRQARLWLDQSFGAQYLNTETDPGKVRALSASAWLNVLLGRTDAAEADLEEARRLFSLYGAGRPRQYGLAMAETWAALAKGQLKAARASLQEHMICSPDRGHPLVVFQSHVLAARLALAEGNPAGYRHYCDQARAVCEAHDMTLSLQFLKVVMADTERKYGAP